MTLEVEGAVVQFGPVIALDGADLAVDAGEVMAVLGPSGCGKSTLLRAIAGLQPLEAGTVSWGGEDLAGTPPHLRRFGLMFQDYALFPHLTVAGNVAFGLRMQGWVTAGIDRRVAEVLGWVELDGLASRRIDGLSGGEQQRVALARALAPSPRLLMLDEPLGALDRNLRERLIVDVRRLLTGHAVTAIYVTHELEEAAAIADRLAVMRSGRVVQTGTLEQIRARPMDAWVGDFVR